MRTHTLNSAAELDAFFKPLHFLNRQPVYRKKAQSDVVRPLIDISENKQSFFIHAELPGVKQQDVKITVDKNLLTLSGKKESIYSKVNTEKNNAQEPVSEVNSETPKAQMVEREYGHFTRSFTLPDSVDAKNMQAKFEDGVLSLEIPKKEEEVQKSFEVKIS